MICTGQAAADSRELMKLCNPQVSAGRVCGCEVDAVYCNPHSGASNHQPAAVAQKLCPKFGL